MRLVTCLPLSRRAEELGAQRLPHRGPQRHALDPLCAPVGRDLRCRDAPHLLVVGLEEVVVEAPAVVGDHVALERVLVLRGPHLGPQVREPAEDRFERAEVLERVHRLDRVVVQLAAVVDAAHARSAQELVGAEDLEPEVVDRLHLGEEAVATDVEAPTVAFRGAADATDDRVALEHGRDHAPLGEHVGRGEPGGAGADDDDVVVGRGGVSRPWRGGGRGVGHGEGAPVRLGNSMSATAQAADVPRRGARRLYGSGLEDQGFEQSARRKTCDVRDAHGARPTPARFARRVTRCVAHRRARPCRPG